jgi:hypothetical protein
MGERGGNAGEMEGGRGERGRERERGVSECQWGRARVRENISMINMLL